MSEPKEDIELTADSSQFNSLDVEEIVCDGPGDTTIRPLRPELLPGAEYELDRVNNPTKPASLPRPGSRSPAQQKPS